VHIPNSSLSDYKITLPKNVIPAWIAGIQAPWMDWSLPSMEPGYPLPDRYDGLSYNLTKWD
jgi:hypothetical protein